MSQIAEKKFSLATLQGGLSVNLNHLKILRIYNVCPVGMFKLHREPPQHILGLVELNFGPLKIFRTILTHDKSSKSKIGRNDQPATLFNLPPT